MRSEVTAVRDQNHSPARFPLLRSRQLNEGRFDFWRISACSRRSNVRGGFMRVRLGSIIAQDQFAPRNFRSRLVTLYVK